MNDEQAEVLFATKSVSTPMTGAKITASSTEVLVGETTTVKAVAVPADTTDKFSIEYTSLNPEIATVDATGKVTAVEKGTATIKATLTTLAGGVFEDTIEINVLDLSSVKVPTPIALYRFQGNLINAMNGKSAQLTGSLVQDAASATEAEYSTLEDGTQAVKFTGAGSYGILLDDAACPKDSSFTISYKVKVNESTQYAAQLYMANILSEGETAPTGDINFDMTDGSGRQVDAHARLALGRGWKDEGAFMCWSNSGADAWGDDIAGDGVQKTGEWATFTTVVDGTKMSFYKNGEFLKSTSTLKWVNDGTAALYLGVNYWDTPFNGEIQDFTVYEEALNKNQITALFSDSRVNDSALYEKTAVGSNLIEELKASTSAYKEPTGGWEKYKTDLQAAVDAANALKTKEDATQEEIDAAVKAIADLVNSLEAVSVKVTADYNNAHVNVEGLVDSKNYGKAIQFSVSANTGYSIEKITYTVAGGTAKELKGSNGVYTIPAEDVTGDIAIKVESSAKEYSITYKIDGATVTDDAALSAVSKFTIESDTFALPQPTAKEGYVFKGWFSNSAMTTEITSIEKGTKKNVTVYGAWEKAATPDPKPEKVAVSKVALSKTSVSIYAGSTTKLTATVTPSNATNKKVTWKSSNSAVASVDANGNVKGIKAGTVTITATADGKSASCKVTVKAKPKASLTVSAITNKAKGKKKAAKVKASAKVISAKKGSVITISAKQSNIGKKITATSGDKKTVSVKVKYTAKTGKATITCTVKKAVKKSVKVTIKCGTKKITKTIKVSK